MNSQLLKADLGVMGLEAGTSTSELNPRKTQMTLGLSDSVVAFAEGAHGVHSSVNCGGLGGCGQALSLT